MDERVRRQWAASEARALAWGGISLVALATGVSRTTIRVGMGEILEREASGELSNTTSSLGRVRRVGGGSKPLTRTDPAIVAALDKLVAPLTRGDPMSPLRWTLKSTGKLSAELSRLGHPVSARTVAALLKASGYSLQGNRKTREGAKHIDRDAQFGHINSRVMAMQSRGQPVVSVDAKKKELALQRRVRVFGSENGVGPTAYKDLRSTPRCIVSGRFQERRERVVSQGQAARGACVRLYRQGRGQRSSDALRGL